VFHSGRTTIKDCSRLKIDERFTIKWFEFNNFEVERTKIIYTTEGKTHLNKIFVVGNHIILHKKIKI